MKQPTLEDHISNVGFAISKATMTGEQFENVRASFLHIVELLKAPVDAPKLDPNYNEGGHVS
jgi:hypothetical protein